MSERNENPDHLTPIEPADQDGAPQPTAAAPPPPEPFSASHERPPLPA